MLGKHHDCNDVVEKVELLLDGELNAKQEQDVLCELQRCMHCLEKYNLEKRFKAFLQNRYDKKVMPGDCMQRIISEVSRISDNIN